MKQKPNSPVFVFNVKTDSEYHECDRAILHMSEAYRDQIVRLMGAVATLKSFDKDVYRLEIWEGYQVQYIRTSEGFDGEEAINDETLDLLSEMLDNNPNQVAQVETVARFSAAGIRFEAPTAIITEDSVMFDCLVKHSNIRLYTETISKEILLALEFSS
ncbi:MAG: hypothetical protein P8J32_04820 [bacterium]|nr:hypothetical protein [bacterium]